MLEKYLGEGKKIIGCFPEYTPEEIVHAAGIIPMGIWGGQVAPSYAGQYAPVFTCSMMRSNLEFGMIGKYEGMSAVIMPMLCDTFRGISSAWRTGVPGIPLIAFIHPQNRKSTASLDFLQSEYEQVKSKIESISGNVITERALTESLRVYDEHNSVMRQFVEVANCHLNYINPIVRHSIMKSAHFMEKAAHAELVKQLIVALQAEPEFEWKGKKVVLTGITCEPNQLLDCFNDNSIAVVGDDLAQESRQYRTDIPSGESALMRLAGQWLNRSACSVIHEDYSTRADLISELVEKYKADGIVVCLMKFCDVEEYDYPMIVKKAERENVPILCIDIDQSITNDEQARTRIQSFAEMI
jgi:benzoyl-CoA reductase/2-hydroxyglutaryl-CoA dehydratase subunit BcrC/BadD/HgdB